MTELERLTVMVEVAAKRLDAAKERRAKAEEEEIAAAKAVAELGNLYSACVLDLLSFARRGGDLSVPANPDAIAALQAMGGHK